MRRLALWSLLGPLSLAACATGTNASGGSSSGGNGGTAGTSVLDGGGGAHASAGGMGGMGGMSVSSSSTSSSSGSTTDATTTTDAATTTTTDAATTTSGGATTSTSASSTSSSSTSSTSVSSTSASSTSSTSVTTSVSSTSASSTTSVTSSSVSSTSSTSVTTSSSASSGSGGGCAGTLEPNACATCAEGACCPEIQACLADADCDDCLNGDDLACLLSDVFDALTACAGSACPEACGCDPVTNEGCSDLDGEACDVTQDETLSCFPAPNTVPYCGTCDNAAGPFCQAGLHCLDGICVEFCHGPSDCTQGGTTCELGVFGASLPATGLCLVSGGPPLCPSGADGGI